jgi:hypothetical protein
MTKPDSVDITLDFATPMFPDYTAKIRTGPQSEKQTEGMVKIDWKEDHNPIAQHFSDWQKATQSEEVDASPIITWDAAGHMCVDITHLPVEQQQDYMDHILASEFITVNDK